MDTAERSLLRVVFALDVQFDFKGRITPESLFDFMERAREAIPADTPDVFWRYRSADDVRKSMDRLVGVRIMKRENEEYLLGGIGLMRAAGISLNNAYAKATSHLPQEWFRQWKKD